jgi:hypothetical protein
MPRTILFGLLLVLAVAAAAAGAAGHVPQQARVQGQAPDESPQAAQDRWQAAKESAEKSYRAGDYVAALQYYLEYTSQAERMGRPGLVAWGKNNTAYMIIKMHVEDPSFDLAPAKKMLEEGLAIVGSTQECRTALAGNLEYVNSFVR